MRNRQGWTFRTDSSPAALGTRREIDRVGGCRHGVCRLELFWDYGLRGRQHVSASAIRSCRFWQTPVRPFLTHIPIVGARERSPAKPIDGAASPLGDANQFLILVL